MPWFAILIPSGIATVSIWAMTRALLKARSIDNTPTSKIRSAPQGYVELVGIAKADPQRPVFAKLSGEPCVWFRYRIEEYERQGKNSSWRSIASGTSGQAIVLQDTTGQCWLHPDEAEVSSSRVKRWRGHQRFPSPTDSNAASSSSLLSGGLMGRYRYSEWRIEADDPLYAIGRFQTLTPPSRSALINEESKALLAQWKQNYPGLLERFDLDQSGDIDIKEWERARQAAHQEASQTIDQQAKPDTVNIMQSTGLSHQPYLIANREPKRLSSRYRWQAIAYLVFAIAAIAFAVQSAVES